MSLFRTIGGLRVVAPTVGLVLALIVFALGWLGGFWLPLDILAHFRLHALGAAIVCALAVFAGRYWFAVIGFGMVAVVVAIGLWGQLSEAFSPPVQASLRDERVVKILSFNSSLRNTDRDRVEAMLRRENAGIVVLLEFGPEKQAMLDDIADLYPFRVDCRERQYCNLALLSKQPILDWEVVTHWVGPPFLKARFGHGYGNLTIIGTHLLRAPHIYAQARQLRALAALIQNTPGPLVVAGDLNATPWSHVLRRFERETRLRRLTSLPSWPVWAAGLPQLAIDHIFVSPDIRVLQAPRLGGNGGSDHLPVAATIALEPR